jgi:hypothetical protein
LAALTRAHRDGETGTFIGTRGIRRQPERSGFPGGEPAAKARSGCGLPPGRRGSTL